MWTRWLPWRLLIKRAARSYGVVDPFALLARLSQFSQPSEVQQPIELLRAGIAFHARGLINTKAIQHNLDWVWPYWAEKQFDPADRSFVPRGYSLTHVNLTHRNWTAVGQPHLPLYPLVDPRGLVTPFYDGWSVDFWVIDRGGKVLLPSRASAAEQFLDLSRELLVLTRCREKGLEIETSVGMKPSGDGTDLVLEAHARASEGGWLAVALRPYNPEGVQFIEEIAFREDPPGWRVNGGVDLFMDRLPEKVLFAQYREGDVLHKLDAEQGDRSVACEVGMATSAAFFPMQEDGSGAVEIRVPMAPALPRKLRGKASSGETWDRAVSDAASLMIPDRRIQYLYETSLRTLLLLSAGDVVPGPYTYRRFWFRDACLMIHSLLVLGLEERAFRALDTFPSRQKRSGYFQSQQGEWDSNGQVLWCFERFSRLTGQRIDLRWLNSALKGARWIAKKRLSERKGEPHSGLLPAGFSAEHLGPNDYYYWDDFWGIEGLRAASRLAGTRGLEEKQSELEREANDFEKCVFRSIGSIAKRRSRGGIPASPYRRMDSGAVGSLVADYPLRLTPPGDARILETVEFLLEHCMHSGAFFQDMIHSGINAYLTLSIAQTLLRCGDLRYRALMEAVADMASPTGQWPEAIHPATRGGCMGDGQHGWAAAEWVSMIRNLFVREETGALLLGSGILPEWLQGSGELSFGPTPTSCGPLTVRVLKKPGGVFFRAEGRWRTEPGEVEIWIPGTRRIKGVELNRDYRVTTVDV